MTTQSNPGALDGATLAGFQETYEAQPAHQLMQNVVTQHDVNDVALNRNIVAQATFSSPARTIGVVVLRSAASRSSATTSNPRSARPSCTES